MLCVRKYFWAVASKVMIGLLLALYAISSHAANAKTEFHSGDFAILGFELGAATLSDVMSELGIATTLPRQEGQDKSICYKANGVAIVFRSGAMGGWTTLTGYTVVRLSLYKHKSLCSPLNIPAERICTGSGLCLGVKRRDILRRFGEPDTVRGNTIHFRRFTRKKMSEEEFAQMKQQWPGLSRDDSYWDVSRYAWFSFSNDVLVSMSFRRFESY